MTVVRFTIIFLLQLAEQYSRMPFDKRLTVVMVTYTTIATHS